MPQNFVLSATSPRRTRWALLHLTADDDFPRVELIGGEVDLEPVRQAIPVVIADPDTVGEDLTEDQVSAEQVLNDQCGYPALTPGGVAGMPVRHILRITRIRSPAGPEYRPQQLQADRYWFAQLVAFSGSHRFRMIPQSSRGSSGPPAMFPLTG